MKHTAFKIKITLYKRRQPQRLLKKENEKTNLLLLKYEQYAK